MKKSGSLTPAWLTGTTVNEVLFCTEYLETHPMKSVNNIFYTPQGRLDDEALLRKEIFDILSPHVTTGLNAKVTNLVEVLRIQCCVKELPLELDRVHVANGTFYLDGSFTEEKQLCQNRLPVAYNINAPVPRVFLTYLHDLLEEEDIPTLRQYLGYCLIPTTKAQKMLIILGNGGEGKSRLGLIFEKLLGSALIMNSVQKIELSKFARADLEGRLVMVDDDMDMNALPKTNVLKTIVTSETRMDLEKKGVQSYQGLIYARLLCFGNGELTSVNDQSEGFYRRQLVLRAKAPPPGRKNDPNLVEKMIPELEGILRWCLGGLIQLILNDYEFTVSDRTRTNARTMQYRANTVEGFLNSYGYFDFVPEASVSSKDLYAAYVQYCTDNAFDSIRCKSFTQQFHALSARYQLTYNNNIYLNTGVRVWGFTGIRLRQNVLF